MVRRWLWVRVPPVAPFRGRLTGKTSAFEAGFVGSNPTPEAYEVD